LSEGGGSRPKRAGQGAKKECRLPSRRIPKGGKKVNAIKAARLWQNGTVTVEWGADLSWSFRETVEAHNGRRA